MAMPSVLEPALGTAAERGLFTLTLPETRHTSGCEQAAVHSEDQWSLWARCLWRAAGRLGCCAPTTGLAAVPRWFPGSAGGLSLEE